MKAIVLALLLCGQLGAGIATGTRAVYNFENNALDGSLNHYDLTNTGPVSFNVTPVPIKQGGYCAGSFDATHYFTPAAGLLSSMSGATRYTIQGWINPSNLVAGRTYVSMDTSGGDFYIQILAAGTVRWNDGSGNYDAGAGLVAATTWTHVACVWNGTNRLVYINGAVQTGSTGQNLGTITSIRIGDYKPAPGVVAFTGFLDQIRFSNVALTTFPTLDTPGTRDMPLENSLQLAPGVNP